MQTYVDGYSVNIRLTRGSQSLNSHLTLDRYANVTSLKGILSRKRLGRAITDRRDWTFSRAYIGPSSSGREPSSDGGGEPSLDGGGEPSSDGGGEPSSDGGGETSSDGGGEPSSDGAAWLSIKKGSRCSCQSMPLRRGETSFSDLGGRICPLSAASISSSNLSTYKLNSDG